MFNTVTGFDLGVTPGILVGVRSGFKVKTFNYEVRVNGLSLLLVFRVFCVGPWDRKIFTKIENKNVCV